MTRVHVIGAGVAGLSAAVRLAEEGAEVRLYESAGQAGGRCRSFFDEALGMRIDNGNHLMMSGNRGILRYLTTIDAADGLTGPDTAVYRFYDLKSGEKWAIEPGSGPVPWWVLFRSRRIPGTGMLDYLSGLKIIMAGPDKTVDECVRPGTRLYKTFWEPLALAALNTDPSRGLARLLGAVLKETFAKGAASCRPLVAREGLSEALVDPAIRFLKERGAQVRLGYRLQEIGMAGETVVTLVFRQGEVSLDEGDRVILAVPPQAAAKLLPGLEVPTESAPIVNVHYVLDSEPAGLDGAPFIGLIGGTAHWLFRRGNIVSVTVSAATKLADRPNDEIAQVCWKDVARVIGMADDNLPPNRVINERRATFCQTPEAEKRRPEAKTRYDNLFMAGDWTNTGLPATIEGAVRSGYKAAELALS